MADVDHGVRSIDPHRLTHLLELAGWDIVGSRDGAYNRLAPPGRFEGERGASLVVPLNPEAVDFAIMMEAALRVIGSVDQATAQTFSVVARLGSTALDAYRFRKETTAPTGLIPWPEGEDLHVAARGTLVAGAKSFRDRMRYFHNRFGEFANRYMDSVLMGQTAPGSYIVTALVPAREFVKISNSRNTGLPVKGVEVAEVREVTVAVIEAIEATCDALAHFRSSKSMSGFEVGVPSGVSYEMTTALAQLAGYSSESDITIDWDPALDPPSGRSAGGTVFGLSPEDAGTLAKAALQLAASPPARHASAVGRIHLLTKKQAGGPGVIGITTFDGDPSRTVRVHLSSEDYHRAVQAHDDDLAVEVAGDLERDGNLYWLYRARVVDVRTPPEPKGKRTGSAPPMPGQTDLFVE
jgi:hypothetical protein